MIICPDHGPYEQIANNHLNGNGCKHCWSEISKQQSEVFSFIEECGVIAEQNNRNILPPMEIDIWIPDKRIGIEYHGTYHHSANTLDRDKIIKYRIQRKALMARDRGIKLYQIYSDEWQESKQIWQSIIKNALGQSDTLYARKFRLITLDTDQQKAFFNVNHLRGYVNSAICYALADVDGPAIAMSFVRKSDHWEIQRFATRLGYVVIGGKSKLYKHFQRYQQPSSVLTYADLRYSRYDAYCDLGLICTGHTGPGYRYINNKVSLSRQKCQKHKLSKLLPDYNDTLSEPENMFSNGYRRLWDAGNSRFVSS